ncbi:hypothetical protein O0L34_g6712 [Tuta absoluta]|nr:hypothetical protein O0L34_g6712 [Tuta absoluta]
MLTTTIVVWCLCWVSAGGVRPAPLDVPLCCPAGHALAASELPAVVSRAAAAAACRPVSRPLPWPSRVFAPALGTYLKKVPGHWRLVPATLPACAELRVLPEHSAPYALLANNATLVMRGAVPQSLPPDRYCGDASAALVCQEDSTSTAVAKCCTKGQVFDNKKCIDDEEAAHETLAALISLANASGLTVGHGWPVCAAGPSWAVAGMLADWRLRDDGALELGTEVLSAGAWCAEGAPEAGAARVLACEADARTAKPKQPLRHALYGAGLAVGAVFLAATLAAGFALPAAHHALHWRCQTHYVAALMLGDALLAGIQLAGDAVPPTLCRVLAVCMHFLFLSAFFWLNTMCFNIWWTFRDFRPTSLERGQEAWRLRVYMLYAWGGPLLLAGAAALLDALPPRAGAGLLRPRLGEERCWFGGDVEILVYFFGPVGVLLLINLALFISTARQLTCGLWRRDEVKSTSERAALGRVCAKLVVVMGVTWGADVVSWVAGGPHYVWYATDLLNALQGLLIFLVVGCQPHAWAAMRNALRVCRRRPPPRAASSTHLPSVGESLTNTTPAPHSHAGCAAPAHNNSANKIPMETVC